MAKKNTTEKDPFDAYNAAVKDGTIDNPAPAEPKEVNGNPPTPEITDWEDLGTRRMLWAREQQDTIEGYAVGHEVLMGKPNEKFGQKEPKPYLVIIIELTKPCPIQVGDDYEIAEPGTRVTIDKVNRTLAKLVALANHPMLAFPVRVTWLEKKPMGDGLSFNEYDVQFSRSQAVERTTLKDVMMRLPSGTVVNYDKLLAEHNFAQ